MLDRSLRDSPDAETAAALPLEAVVDAVDGGWSVRLPVRAENVSVTKEAILLEEVRLWRNGNMEDRPVTATVQSERLRVDRDQAVR